MNSSTHLAALLVMRPAAWLAVLVALYFSSSRRAGMLEKGGFAKGTQQESSFQYKTVGIFALSRLLASLSSLLLDGHLFRLPLQRETAIRLDISMSWVFYAIAVFYCFGIIAALISNALEQFPDIIQPARITMRWLAGLVMTVALVAHLPLASGESLTSWLLDSRVSFNLCLFFFEAGLLVLFCMNLRRLGLSLRSRSVGLAFGLMTLGASDILWSMAHEFLQIRSFWSVALALFAVAVWCFYIVTPEPPRLAHSLGRESVLMTWQQLAAQLKENRGSSEKSPFIATIESRVEAVLAKNGFKGT